MRALLQPWTQVKAMFFLTLDTLETLVVPGGNKSLFAILIGLLAFWHVYTPIHELLHVLGCVATGGTVTELHLKPQYGGTLLQHVFPFVVPDSDYAGQLKGFTVPNGLAYAVVDFLPYVLSLFGAAAIAVARRKRSSWLFGPALILAWVPAMSVTGDYYEGVSLVTTTIAEALQPEWPEGVLLSDDVFRSIGTLHGDGRLNLLSSGLVVVGILGAVYLVMITLALQTMIARKWLGPEVFDRNKREPVASPAATDG